MNTYLVLGLMSGTSLDGLDLAYCKFIKNGSSWSYELLDQQSIDYDPLWRTRLKHAIDLSAIELLQLHVDYGTWLGEQVSAFQAQVAQPIDFIASHGHTVFHQVDKRLTYQIGSGQEIANITGLKVVCDFRTQDVLLGGQGAPLVPIGDRELFHDYDFCLNLGGIANVSLEWKQQRIAYDIGPANMLLNHLMAKVGKTYDHDGAFARSGSIDPVLLNTLNQLAFYKEVYPKSLGFEWFKEQVIPIFENCASSIPDQLHTAVWHISEVISRDILSFTREAPKTLLCTGGGAKNSFLMETIQEQLGEKVKVIIPPATLIDFKEAIVFALMGVKRMEREINCLKSVTGAQRDSCGGVIYEVL